MQGKSLSSLAPHEACGVTRPPQGPANTLSGIGRAIATALAQSGASVAILDLELDRLADTEADCAKFDVRVKPYACDVTQFDACEMIFFKSSRILAR